MLTDSSWLLWILWNKTTEYLETFGETLKAIFKIYYDSTKKRRKLNKIGQLLHDKVAYFSGLKSTRWLPSRLRCFKAIEKSYEITVAYMETMAGNSRWGIKQKDTTKAERIVAEMKTEQFAQYLYFTLDYISLFSHCSTDFRYDDLGIFRVIQTVGNRQADTEAFSSRE